MEEKKLYYNKSGLKARGWTDAMIRDLLGDIEIKQGLTCSAGQQHFNYQYYYLDTAVEAIEKTKAFKDRKRKKAKAVVGSNAETASSPTTEPNIKVGIKRIELRPRKTDFRFTWKDGNRIRYEDANFRPERKPSDLSERVKLLPYTLEQVIDLAESDRRKETGWKYYPRVSYRISFFHSVRREEDGEPRNEFISQMTYSPHPTRNEINSNRNCLDPNDAVYKKYAEEELARFWSSFDATVKQLELPKATIEKLRKRIEGKFV